MKNLGAYAVPVFILFMLAEIIITARKQMKAYKAKDTAANVSLGLFGLFLGTIMKGVAIGVYSFVHQFAVYEFSNSWLALFLCLIGSDFIFYIFHRLGHETRLFWAAHVTHHTSKFYNFSVAVRIPLHTTHRFLFWAPLALFFDPMMIVFIDSITMIYQFFLHTELVGKLGPIEWIFNTPSHHRVHHSSNAKYLDKNYSGIFIIWDRLFGTFKVEEETPDYGITEPIDTYNPIKLATHGWAEMFKLAFNAPNFREAICYLFKGPGWSPEQEDNRRVVKKRTLAFPSKRIASTIVILLLTTSSFAQQPENSLMANFEPASVSSISYHQPSDLNANNIQVPYNWKGKITTKPPLEPLRIGGELLVGAGVGIIGGGGIGIFSGLVAAGIAGGGWDGLAAGLVTTAGMGAIGYSACTALGTYFIGNLGNQTGNYWSALAGSAIGLVAGGGIVLVDNGQYISGLNTFIAPTALSTIGGVIGFNISREYKNDNKLSLEPMATGAKLTYEF